MEEKLKVNLYVRGDIIAEGYASCAENATIAWFVPESGVDLSNAIVVDGPMKVKNLVAWPGARVAVSGNIYFNCRNRSVERSEE